MLKITFQLNVKLKEPMKCGSFLLDVQLHHLVQALQPLGLSTAFRTTGVASTFSVSTTGRLLAVRV